MFEVIILLQLLLFLKTPVQQPERSLCRSSHNLQSQPGSATFGCLPSQPQPKNEVLSSDLHAAEGHAHTRLLHFLFPWDLVLEALLHQQQVGGGAIINEQR